MAGTPQLILTKQGGALVAQDERGHSVTIPMTLDGLRLLSALLDARAASPNARLGHAARPTQQMIDKFLHSKKLEQISQLLKDF